MNQINKETLSIAGACDSPLTHSRGKTQNKLLRDDDAHFLKMLLEFFVKTKILIATTI